MKHSMVEIEVNKMTLDEAIAHAKEVASEQRRRSGICTVDDSECDKFSNCINCAEEHEQLVTWLEDLKRRREYDYELTGIGALKNAYKSGYNKTIDDLIAKCENAKFTESDEISLSYIHTGVNSGLSMAIHFAEQLKAGVTND